VTAPPAARPAVHPVPVGSAPQYRTDKAGAGALAGQDYVAMGASFASGPGIPGRERGSPRVCGRSTNSYPNLLARRLDLALRDVTCQGATTADILTREQLGQPPQIDAIHAGTDLVTITVGGNDVGYLASLINYSCSASGGTHCVKVNRIAMSRTLTQIRSRLAKIAREIHRRAPRSRVLLVDYLSILPASGRACTGVPLMRDQVAFELNVARELDTAIRQAAADTGAQLVEVSAASRDHNNACGRHPYIEKYKPGRHRISYHPNEAGMAMVADLIADQLRN
jgi:lysophospholipase L1-like esterase